MLISENDQMLSLLVCAILPIEAVQGGLDFYSDLFYLPGQLLLLNEELGKLFCSQLFQMGFLFPRLKKSLKLAH